MTRDRPLRVVVYTDSAGMGGAEISLRHLVTAVSSDVEITVVGVSQAVVEAIACPAQPTRILPAQGIPSLTSHLLAFSQLRPDIIHLNLCTPWAGATGLMAALALPQVRVVRVDQLSLRTTDAIALWRTRALSLRVDAHVAVGQTSARRMEDFYALGRNTVLSIPNGVPDVTDEPKPPPVQPNGQIVVGSIGRLDAMKAHDVLLRAIAQVEGIRVVILGEGEQRTPLEKLAIELGVSDRLDLKGWVDNPRSYLSGFDVIVLPSRSEGFPLAIVEAMLAARPVIATRVGSVAEAVTDGETGFLVEKDNVAGLAQALRKLRDRPELRIQFGQRAREKATAHFTADHMRNRYEHLWHNVLASPRTPRLRVPRPHD